MKKLLSFNVLLVLFAASLLFATTAFTTKPGQEVNPNGFPSGEHFNLNLNAKKLDYDCTPVEYDESANIIYGKVIFIPQDTSSFPDQKVGILMESGKKGPKSAPDTTTLQVTDKCAGFDGDPAILRLPKSEYGYDVYLRAKGKPTDIDENLMIFGKLQWVEDENGTPLVYLGTLPDGELKNPLKRPKGKTTAVDISYLFKWVGSLCYEGELPAEVPNPEDYNAQCCSLTDSDGDGIYESYSCTAAPDDLICGEVETLLYCTDSFTSDWIFNIEAFVGYLWELDNNGVRSAQVRFYPRKAE